MKIYGIEITEVQIEACLKRMRSHGEFMAGDIAAHVVDRIADANSSVRENVAYRLADRLIQRERKAGRIKYDGKYWNSTQ